MQAETQQLASDLETLIKDAVKGTGVELKIGEKELAAYIAERTAVLALSVGTPGYQEALIAERDNIALKGAISLDKYARRVDQKIIGIIQTALLIGSRALTGLA